MTVAALLPAACTDGPPNPAAPNGTISPAGLSADAVKSREATATVRWNAIARAQTLTHAMSNQAGVRTFAYLSLAQYNAAVAARHPKGKGDHRSAKRGKRPSVPAAVASASAVVLTSVFADQAAYFDAQVALARSDDDDDADFAAGEALGRAVGASVLASAATDGFTASVAGVVIPVCPGCWLSAPGVGPIFPLLGQMRPFFLSTGSQFRPGPPPTFGSPQYLAALAEVRHFSDTRTPEQDALAKFWAKPGGYAVIHAYANQLATDEITKIHLDERRAAHVLAIMNMTSMDAFIACHDAKYTYWLIRPSQVDPGIVLAIPLPNHPSYPSNHACVTGSAMAVLASFFPSDASYLRRLADDAAISRVYGGIHYRFDLDVGLTLGRKIARYALAHDVKGDRAYALR